MTPEYEEVRFDLRDIAGTGRFPADRRRVIYDALVHFLRQGRG